MNSSRMCMRLLRSRVFSSGSLLVTQQRTFSSVSHKHHAQQSDERVTVESSSSNPFSSPFPFFQQIRVRGYELDSFNHVNNAVYLQWLEMIRWEFMMNAMKQPNYGTGGDLFGPGVLPVVRRVELDYLAETKMGDILRVAYWPRTFSRSSFLMGYQMIIEDTSVPHLRPRIGKTVLKASTVQTCIQRSDGKKVDLPEKWKAHFPRSDPGDSIDFTQYGYCRTG